jgi:rare lipoprotein A
MSFTSARTGVEPGRAERYPGTCAALMAATLFLTACGQDDGAGLFGKSDPVAAPQDTLAQSTRLPSISADIEAPEVFASSEDALWTGTPSFGGVWVAHPEALTPEQVIIRNTDNGKSVIGSLFKRERDNPGPRFQVSSDAARALSILAGQPTTISVIALRRSEASAPTKQTGTNAASGTIETGTLAPARTAKPAQIPAPSGTTPQLFVQIGIFNIKTNATGAAQAMTERGLDAEVREHDASDKPFWRVLVAADPETGGREATLQSVRKAGFADAYFVTD